MTMSQRSSLPISQAVITPTHMELSINQLLHTGTQPPSRESERDRETVAERGEREWEFPTPSSKQPLAVPISSMRRVLFNYSYCGNPTGKCHESTVEQSFSNLFWFRIEFVEQLQFPFYWVNIICAKQQWLKDIISKQKVFSIHGTLTDKAGDIRWVFLLSNKKTKDQWPCGSPAHWKVTLLEKSKKKKKKNQFEELIP